MVSQGLKVLSGAFCFISCQKCPVNFASLEIKDAYKAAKQFFQFGLVDQLFSSHYSQTPP